MQQALQQKVQKAASAIAQECFAMRVRYLNRSLTSIYDEVFRPLSITASQVNMLVAIITQQTLSPSELGEILNIEKSTLSRNLDRMRKAGWVEIDSSQPGRSHTVQASEKGQALLLNILPLWQKAQETTCTLLGSERSKAIREVADHARSEIMKT